MIRFKFLKVLTTLIFFMTIIFFITSCDNTLLEIYTQVNANNSGSRSIDLAIKTQYLKKGKVTLSKNESLFDKILQSLPAGKIETYEKEDYTHFKSTVEFDDINFLQHVSIDNFSETPPERFYAKMEKKDYFFNSDYFFYDYIDMNIDEAIIEAGGKDSDLARIAGLFNADKEMFQIIYQIKFPVKIIKSNADVIGDNNIAIWKLKYGDEKNINIEGKKTKFLSYFLVVLLGFVVIFIIFIIFALIFSRKRRRITKSKKPIFAYDNYFKKDKFFSPLDNKDDFSNR
ncbi:MAG: hypothetical protein M1365_01190 [Actinobacteria bacterium]|nr:hypothetical protein [Actinomycetota bacterium]